MGDKTRLVAELVHRVRRLRDPQTARDLFKSIPLADYRMEFLSAVERKGLGFVYRAIDFDNYYSGRITVTAGGSLRPFFARRTLYGVQVEAKGGHFVTRIDNQLVDAFSDSRLPAGGVGFFAGSGESARISWLPLSGHNDLLGKSARCSR